MPVEADRIAQRLRGPYTTADALVGQLWVKTYDGSYHITVEDEDDGCPLLENDRCRVHDIKPIQCATYPFWPELIESEHTWNDEQQYCEGINLGDETYARYEIADLLAERARTREASERTDDGSEPTET